MDRIFSEAENVVCWLCDSTQMFDRLMNFLPAVDDDVVEEHSKQSSMMISDQAIWDEIFRIVRERSSWRSYSAEEEKELIQSFTCLMELDWFHRVWIVQEAVLARSLSFQVGDHNVSATSFKSLLKILRISGHSTLSSVHSGSLVRSASVFELRDLYTVGRFQEVDLPVLLDGSKYRGATDDRDRVIGLTGLLNMSLRFCYGAVSYDKSVEMTYMEMTIKLMEFDNSPEPLKFCCFLRQGSSYQIASWSEDWSARSSCGAQGARSMLKRPRIFHASSHKPLFYRFLPEKKALVIRGNVLGAIRTVVRPSSVLGDLGKIWTQWIALSDDPNHLETICRTLVADHDADSEYFGRASREFIQQLVRWAHEVNTNDIDTSLEILRQSFPRASARIKDALRLFTIFLTEDGFIGQSCKHVEPRDLLAFLHGGKLPFILRNDQAEFDMQQSSDEIVGSASKVYRLVGGECFVCKLADGQGHAFADNHGYPDRDLILV